MVVERAEDVATLAPKAGGPSAGLPEVLAGRYQILETIGEGGMGIVCRGFDMDLEEVVAIKVLRAELGDDDALRARFRREVKLARRVTHPRVARVFEFGRDGGSYFLTMEFVAGESLQELLRREAQLEAGRAIEVVIGIAEGLAAAHAAGVVHGDIKPGNVLVAPGRGAVVTDFGIAQAFADAPRCEAWVSGTPLYMAPEQARSEALGPPADVYAVGVVLYRALTGEAPWPRSDPMGTILAKRRGLAPDLSHLEATSAPAGLRALIAECLEVSPARRPADGHALVERLVALRGSAPRPIVGAAPAMPLASGRGARWVVVERLVGEPELAWVGADLVDVLGQARGIRVIAGPSTAAPAGAARVSGEVRRSGDEVIVRLRVDHGEAGMPDATFTAGARREGWHGLGRELAARVAAALERSLSLGVSGDVFDADVSELYVQARHAYATFHFDQAERLFAAALARAPDNQLVRIGHTLTRVQATLLSQRCGVEAVAGLRASVDAVVADVGESGDMHLLRARIAYGLGDVVAAAIALRAAVARAPSLVEAHVLLAELLLETGRLADAERRLDVAAALSSGSPGVWHLRARLWAYQGRWDEVYALVDGPLATVAFRGPVFARLLLWRPHAAAVARLAEIYEENRDGLTPEMVARGRAIVEFIRRPDARPALLADTGWGMEGVAHARFKAFRAQVLCEMCALAGDAEAALGHLEQGYREHGLTDWQWIQHCPALASIRGAARFQAVAEGVRARADALSEAIWG